MQRSDRLQRFGGEDRNPQDPARRPDSAVDKDRVLYSDALRRMSGVTQVASTHEGRLYHDRLTHSMKVGQVARRIAERIIRQRDLEKVQGLDPLIEDLGGLDPEVAETAAYCHDLGTPPFGHNGEDVLDRLVRESGDLDGFEGNAQTFRIVTRLEIHRGQQTHGLGLTRATLRAVLKYPWLRHLTSEQPSTLKERKWGAYRTDQAAFDFAMQLPVSAARRSGATEERSLEAEIMDWADDVTYAVHDLEDFYRAGIVPLERVAKDKDFSGQVLQELLERKPNLDRNHATECWGDLIGYLPMDPYEGTTPQRSCIYNTRSKFIDRFVNGFQLEPKGKFGPTLRIDSSQRISVTLLKELTWMFVIEKPELASQRVGQARIIEDLYKIYCAQAEDPDQASLLPPHHLERLREAGHTAARVAADFISTLAEAETYALHRRLCGYQPGSLRDVLVGT